MSFSKLELNHLSTWAIGIYPDDVVEREEVIRLILFAETIYPEVRKSKPSGDCHNWWVWLRLGGG